MTSCSLGKCNHISLSNVKAAFQDLGFEFIVDDTSESISAVSKTGYIVALTSPKAIRSYDAEHPERIVCILVFCHSEHYLEYRVVCNNRGYDLKTQIKSLTNKTLLDDLHEGFECAICLKNPKHVVHCSTCCGSICVNCHDKLEDQFNGFAWICPFCRSNNLVGTWFGTPYCCLPGLTLSGSGDVADVFVNGIIANLDGLFEIWPRINSAWPTNFVKVIHKLSRTDRYGKGSDRISDARQMVRRLANFGRILQNNGVEVILSLYVVRLTHRVDANANTAIVEVSMFQLLMNDGNERIVQADKDSWLDVLKDTTLSDAFMRQKIEYVTPNTYVIPTHVTTFLCQVADEFKKIYNVNEMTVFVHNKHDRIKQISQLRKQFNFASSWWTSAKSNHGFNCDVLIETLEPVTMSLSMYRTLFAHAATQTTRSAVCICAIKTEQGCVDIRGFDFDASSCNWMDPADLEPLWAMVRKSTA